MTLRDVANRKTAHVAYYVVLGILAAIGISVLGYRLLNGMRVTALTSSLPWGLWVAVYIYFVGLSAGSFLLSTLIYVFNMRQFERIGRIALLSALFSLGAALVFVWVDLGHPLRAWEMYATPHWTSVMTIEGWLYIVYGLLILAELWLLMRSDLARLGAETSGARSAVYRILALGHEPTSERSRTVHAATQRWLMVLGIVGIPVAIGVHGGTGSIFAVLVARPYWSGGIMPIIFLISALVSGTALVLFIYAFQGRRDEEHGELVQSLGRLLGLFIAIDALLLIFDALTTLYAGGPEHREAWEAVTTGRYAFVFWGGQIGLAMVLPLVLLGIRATRESTTWLGLAGLSTVVGIVCVRLDIVIPGLVLPEIPGLDTAFVDSRLAFEYFPSAWEWLSTIGLIAAVVLAFSAAFELLPIYEHEEAGA